MRSASVGHVGNEDARLSLVICSRIFPISLMPYRVSSLKHLQLNQPVIPCSLIRNGNLYLSSGHFDLKNHSFVFSQNTQSLIIETSVADTNTDPPGEPKLLKPSRESQHLTCTHIHASALHGHISPGRSSPPNALPDSTSFSSFRSREQVLRRGFASLQRSLEVELRLHALNTMRGVDVLHQRNLVASRGALAGDDGAVGEEVLPYLPQKHRLVRRTN